MFAALADNAMAADVTKASSGTDVAAAASWTGGSGPAPGPGDVALWDTGSLGGTGAAPLTLGSSTSWQGIRMTAGSPVVPAPTSTTASSTTLTLGAAGIDLSAATQNFSFPLSGLILAADQTWNIASGRTLAIINGAAAPGVNLGGFTLTKSGTGTATFTRENISNGTLNITAGTISITGGSSQAYTIANTVTANVGAGSTLNFTNNTSGNLAVANLTTNLNDTTAQLTIGSGNATLNGPITGSGKIAFTSTNTTLATLSGTNTYTGTTTIGATNVQFTKRVALYNATPANWTATNLIVNSPAALTLSVGGTGEFTTGDIDTIKTLGTATGGFKSGANLGFDTTNAPGGNFSYSGGITNPNGGANNLGVAKYGTNTLTLSGTNTYTGATTVSAGTLLISKQLALPATRTATTVVVNSGATLALNVGAADEFAAADIDTIKALGTATGGFKAGSILGLDTTNAPGGVFTYGSVVSNTNSGANAVTVSKLGSGALALTGANTHTGGTAIQSGTLQVGSNTATGTGTLTLNPGTRISSDGTTPHTLANALAFNSSGTAYGFGDAVNNGKLTFTQAATVGSLGKTYDVLSDVEFQSGIGGTTGGLTKTGSGKLIISGNSTYAGTTIISAGVIQIGSGGAGGAPGSGAITNNAALVFNRDATADLTVAAVISGTGTVTQGGTGKTILTGANTYTGDTTVNAGTLSLSTAFLADASKVNIATSGAVLDLNYAGTDTVDQLIIGGAQQLTGTWGSSISGATHVDDAHFSGTGTLTVTTGSSALTYATWASSRGLTAGVNDGFAADPDGDGKNNFEEFAFDGQPMSGASEKNIISKIGTVGGEHLLTLSFPVRNGAAFFGVSGELVSSAVDGVIYHIQGSIDLQDWTSITVQEITGPDATALQSTLPVPGPGWTNRSFCIPGSDPALGNSKVFIRAKVTE